MTEVTYQRTIPTHRWPRFSLRMLLALVTVCAYAAYWYAQHRRAAEAERDYHWLYAGWDSDQETPRSVLLASRQMYEAQCRVPFADRQTASLEHLRRAVKIEGKYKAHEEIAMFGEPPWHESRVRKREEVQAFVAEAKELYVAAGGHQLSPAKLESLVNSP